ncbi:MAG: hypothetical protein RIB57_12405 [Pelagibacterium sp.]|uniref:hypothetical protein n=1 Tax=Pelagibacterium sp. TaxID=1967288 RepID=UPI0032EBE57E
MIDIEPSVEEYAEVSGTEGPIRDIQHDDWLVPDGEPLNTVATYLFEEIEAAHPRPKKQRRDATQRRRDMVANIVANVALLTAHHPEGSRLMVSAGNLRSTRYDRPLFSRKAFVEVIEVLENLKYLHREKGKRGGLRTTIEPTDALRWLLPPAGSSLPLARLPGAETIVLKGGAGRNKPKVLLDYEDNAETMAMRSEMETINTILNATTITLDGQVQPPVHMVRMFQVENASSPPEFSLHGRLYGGFWEHLPKAKRHLIQIDGHQVAELDFSGMFVQLAYAEAGLPPPDGDPYEGLESLPRDAAKIATSALLCKSGPMKRLPPHLRAMLDDGWTGRLVTQSLVHRHPGIAHLFGQSTGLRLMHTESRVAVAALLDLAAQGIPALPIHDALLVAKPQADQCRAAMQAASARILGRHLPIRRKDNFPPMP